MLKHNNYKSLTSGAKGKLVALICKIYSTLGVKKVDIKKDGTIIFITHWIFGFPIGTKMHIFDLLNNHLPRDISSTIWASEDLTSTIREEIDKLLEENKKATEIVKAQLIINMLYSFVNGEKEHEKVYDKFINSNFSKSIISLPREERICITPFPVVEEEEKKNILYIFDVILKPKRVEYIRKTLYLTTLFLSLNALRIIGILNTYEYMVKGKPYIERIIVPGRTFYDTG